MKRYLFLKAAVVVMAFCLVWLCLGKTAVTAVSASVRKAADRTEMKLIEDMDKLRDAENEMLGRYQLHKFENEFLVFDTATGEAWACKPGSGSVLLFSIMALTSNRMEMLRLERLSEKK
jgi:hypothetical protein